MNKAPLGVSHFLYLIISLSCMSELSLCVTAGVKFSMWAWNPLENSLLWQIYPELALGKVGGHLAGRMASSIIFFSLKKLNWQVDDTWYQSDGTPDSFLALAYTRVFLSKMFSWRHVFCSLNFSLGLQMRPLSQLMLSSFYILSINLSAIQTGSGSLDFPHWNIEKFLFLMVSCQVAWPLTGIQGRWSSERWQGRAGCVPTQHSLGGVPWCDIPRTLDVCLLLVSRLQWGLLSHCFLWASLPSHPFSHFSRSVLTHSMYLGSPQCLDIIWVISEGYPSFFWRNHSCQTQGLRPLDLLSTVRV